MSTFGIDDAGALACDVDTLIGTRMLVQANSGGGKSFLVRRILEQTHGRVQQIVIDPEGEFATLRERFDYVHAAAVDGDTIVHTRSAALLAEKLLELNASAVLDLYELKAHDRITFVRLFLEGMINAPKKLWHPVLVVVDEAHIFCPQVGSAESGAAVIDLCSRGRKRGFAALLATQRIQKLHKDAAAELNNKLIGRTSLDVDLARASDELGFTKARWSELRDLPAGQFFAAGPAFSRPGVTLVQAGGVQTTHPKAGQRIALVAPPPTSAIRALLPQLSDLPAEAEERERTTDELRAEVRRLEGELAERPTAASTVDHAAHARIAELEDLLKAASQTASVMEELGRIERDLQGQCDTAQAVAASLRGRIARCRESLMSNRQDIREGIGLAESVGPPIGQRRDVGPEPRPAPITHLRAKSVEEDTENERAYDAFHTAAKEQRSVANGPALGNGAIRMVTALKAFHPRPLTRTQLATLSGFTPTGGGFRNVLSELTTAGAIEKSGDHIALTARGFKAVGTVAHPRTTAELVATWGAKIGSGARRMLAVLIGRYPATATRQVLASEAGLDVDGGGFRNCLSELSTNGLIEKRGKDIRASESFFLGARR